MIPLTNVPAGLLRRKPRQSILAGRRVRIVVAGLAWAYLAAILAVWGLLYFGGDRWWFATLMLFGPRWPYALPLAVLVPAVVLSRRRLLIIPLLISTVVLVGPVMRYCVPMPRFASPEAKLIRVLTCNVQGHSADTRALMTLIAGTKPDIVALQECPRELWEWPAGWHIRRHGALLIASRFAMRDTEIHWKYHPPNVLGCVLETDDRQIYFCTIHLQGPGRAIENVLSRKTLISPSKSPKLTEKIERRRRESDSTSQWFGSLDDYPLIVAGDFNMPADSSIFRRYWGKYANAFSSAGFGFGNTKHSPVADWLFGARIDHILAGPGFRAVRCWVGPDIGSDHLPVIADLGLKPQSGRPE